MQKALYLRELNKYTELSAILFEDNIFGIRDQHSIEFLLVEFSVFEKINE
jgi:hypothetical protein